MGKVASRLNRQFYRFNAENRAHREIGKDKPKPAPRHATEERIMKTILEETKDIKEQELIKDKVLDDYLKKVFVVSHDPVEEKRKKPSEKGLFPLSRSRPEETELGYHDPQIIPKGKITLQQAMKLLADNQGSPEIYGVSRISEDYQIPKEDAQNLLEYFSSFKIHINEEHRKLTRKEKVLSYIQSSKNVEAISDSDQSETKKVKLKVPE